MRKQLYDFSHYGKWCHSQVKPSKHGRDSHEQIFDTAAKSHSRISWLQSSNSRVGISRETSPRILHPLLSSASAWVASSESQTSATLHLSVTVYTQTYDELAAAYHVSRAGNIVYLLSWKTIQHQLVPNIAKVYSLSQNNTQFEGNSHV